MSKPFGRSWLLVIAAVLIGCPNPGGLSGTGGSDGGDSGNPPGDATPVAAPVFSLPTGTYAGVQTVTMSCVTTGVSIRYTLDGTDPSPSKGTVYFSALSFSANALVKAVAYSSVASSPVSTATYLFTFKLTVVPDAAGETTPGGGSLTNAVQGAATNIAASPRSGYGFGRWVALKGSVSFGDATSSTTAATITSGANATIAPLYTGPGCLDLTFGSNGRASSLIGSAYVGYLTQPGLGTALDAGGNIIVVGAANGGPDFLVARCSSNGSLDGSFGSGGKTTTDFGGTADYGVAAAVQPDGRILAAGTSTGTTSRMAVARYTSCGDCDATFGTDGRTSASVSGRDLYGHALAVAPDGSIFVAGSLRDRSQSLYRQYDMAVAKFSSSGILDASFGSGGIVSVSFGGYNAEAYGVAVQGDGKILLGGSALDFRACSRFALARLQSDGTLDSGFGNDAGKRMETSRPVDQWGFAMKLLGNGSILLGGRDYAVDSTRGDFALARFTSSGALDTSFGSNGWTCADLGENRPEYAFSLMLQSDGKIVLAGVQFNDSYYQYALARYTSGGAVDTGFHVRGNAVLPSLANTEYAFSALESNGRIVVAGWHDGGSSSASLLLAGYQE